MFDSFASPWTVALEAPLSMEFLRWEFLSGLSFPSPGTILNPGLKPKPPHWRGHSSLLSHLGSQWNAVNVAVQSPSHVRLFAAPWTAACQASPSLTISWSLPRFMSIASVMPFSSSDALFSCPQSLPASETFPMSHLFTSDDQTTWVSVSASVLPVNIQGWSPLRLTGLISLLSKGLSGVIYRTTDWKHQFLGILPSL